MISCFLVLGIAALAGISYFFFTGLYTYELADEHYRVMVHSYRPIFKTDKYFLSVALDTSFMGCFIHLLNNESWDKLQEVSSFLAPAYLRLGGTQADELIFVEDNPNIFKNFYSCAPNQSFSGPLYVTGEDLLKINNFTKTAGFTFIMDLNVLLRSGPHWNSSNAEKLLEFFQENDVFVNFQLGNEPNSFPHVFNISLPGRQLAEDFDKLRSMLNSSKAFKHAKLIGPDVTRPKKIKKEPLPYLKDFLSHTNSVDAASWHHYYFDGRTADVGDFINPDVFDEFPRQAEAVLKTVRNVSLTLPIWLSETSAAYGGGAPYLSDRFVASFLWLDKLGIAAKNNISVVIRQSLFKSYYALINPDFVPSPDFWISFFFKNLVGETVLETVSIPKGFWSKHLRFYAHCLAATAPLDGSVVVYGMNLLNTSQVVLVKGILYETPVHTFTFRAENNDVRSRTVLLNDKLLTYDPGNMYDLLKSPKESDIPLVIPYRSIVFWVFKEAVNSTCNR